MMVRGDYKVNKNIINENKINKGVQVYIVISILYSFVGRVIPIKQLSGESINGWIYISLAGIGVLFLLVDFFTTKKWYKGKWIAVLYAFIVIMGISSIINIKYGFVDNAKTIVWTTIQIGLIYTFYTRYSKEDLIIFLDKIWITMSTFWFFPVLYSIFQFVICNGYVTKVGTKKIRQGFYENRLFGVFNDPNYAAIFSLCVIVAIIYLLKKISNKKMRIFFKFNLIVQYMYTVLSGSRTVLVCMTLVIGLYTLAWWYQKVHGKYTWKKILGFVLIPVASMSIVVGAFQVVQRVSVILPMTYYYFADGENGNHIKIGFKGEIDESLTERKDGKSGNISNNRTTIWKAYLQNMKGDLLLGGSPRNVLAKWQEKEPKGYLVQTGYETHNGYLFVLVGTGILGMITILVYIILYVYKVLKYVKENKTIPSEIMFIFVFLVIVLVDVCFFTELFFIHSLISILFWLHCGLAMKWLDSEV